MANNTLIIPANLNLEALLVLNPPHDNTVIADDLADICHSIYELQSIYKLNSENPQGFVNLHSVILQARRRNYSSCLQYLIDTGVIESDHHYIPNVKSRGFRFTEQYFGMGFKEFKLTSRKALRLKAKRDRFKKTQELKLAGMNAPHLYQWFQTDRLTIDVKSASSWINESNNLKLRVARLGITTDTFKSINHKHDLYRLMVKGCHNRDYNCKVDITAGRFHSRLTNLKGELRHFLRYDGKTLTSLDIKNSQPYLSLCLFDESFYDTEANSSGICLSQLHSGLSEFLNQQKKDECKLTIHRAVNSSAFAEYRKLVLEGRIYEKFMELIFHKTGKTPTREDAKRMLYTVFFGDPNTVWANTGALALFDEHFPEVATLFNMLKSMRYQDLAILLQRIESHMVIQTITKNFSEMFPDACLFTIHDSILTLSSFIDDLEESINSHFVELIGAPPRLSKTEMNSQAVFETVRNESVKIQTLVPVKNWTPVIGYEGLYEINVNSEFRSLNAKHNGKLLKTRIDRAGYLTVRLSRDGHKSTFWVHRLIAEHFIPNPDNLVEVNHLNGCKLDNSLTNLAWVSHRMNCQHAVDKGLSNGCRRRPVKDLCNGRIFTSQRHASSVYDIPYPTLKGYLSGRRPNPTCLRLLD